MGIFNWKPQKLPLQPIDANSRAASEAMAGYVPMEADPNNQYYTQGVPAENAAAAMQGYGVQQKYIGRTPESMNNAGQGAGYQFNDPSFNAYTQQQQKEEQAAAAKQQRISSIKSEISTLEKRLADNMAKLQNWTGNADKIAAIEARKFNSSDPTSIWRWKVDRDEARKIANAEKEKGDELAKKNAQYEIDNELDSMIVDDTMTSNEKKVFLSKLASLKTVAQKSGLPTDKIEAKISEVKGDVKVPVEDIVDYEELDLDRYDGTPIEKGEAAAEKLLNIDADKVTQGDLAKFMLAVKEGRIKVKGTTLDKIDSLYSKVIDRDKKRREDKEREEKLLGKGKMLSTEEKEFMKGRKGIKLFTDSYGNEWFERV